MKLLKSIGALFVKLWRWIKETAWVQPLLIVGAIFAVIFSIPYFTSWVETLSSSSSTAYYANYQISLNGEEENKTDISDADKFTTFLYENSYFHGCDDIEAAKTKVDQSNVYGEKFFLMFVDENCDNCEKIQPAFELLEKRWGTQFVDCFANDSERTACNFKLHTIFKDETSDNDDDESNINDYTAFQKYLNNFNDFFEEAGERFDTENNNYRRNAGLESNASYDHFVSSDEDSFETPTLLLVDFTREAFEAGNPGVCEVLFGVNGSTDYEKAQLMMDMWNHLDDGATTSISNKFTENYKK